MGQIVKPVKASFVFDAEYAGQYCEAMERSMTLLAVPFKVSGFAPIYDQNEQDKINESTEDMKGRQMMVHCIIMKTR